MVTSLAAVVCSTAALVALARDARLEAQRMSATHEGTQRRTQLSRYHFIFVDAAAGKLTRRLCQNCVTYPPKPWANIVFYGETATRIDVLWEVVDQNCVGGI